MKLKVMLLSFFVCIGLSISMAQKSSVASPKQSKLKKQDSVKVVDPAPRMTFDFKDTDIRDIVRTISIAYGLNIVMDKDIAAKVTIHLTDVPVLDGLKTVLTIHGLALVQEGNIYRIAKVEDKGKSVIAVGTKDSLNMDIDNMDIKDFIRDISAKTGLNIIAEKGVEGKISGTLRNINIEQGIRALFEANDYLTRYRGNIMLVSAKETNKNQSGNSNNQYQSGGYGSRSGGGGLEIRAVNGLISLNLTNVDLGEALVQIANEARLNYITYGQVRGEVRAKLENVTLEKAIGLLLAGTNFAFTIRDSILLIGDRNSSTPSGQVLSMSELVHLKHVKGDNFLNILPRSVPPGSVQLIKEQNAVLITGTQDMILQVRDFIDQVDIPTPQIMIEAIVVEFSKDKGSEWGVEAGSGNKNDSTGINYIPGLSLPFTGKWLKGHWPQDFKFTTLGFLPDDFMLKLHFLESQKKAKIMAQPRIATINGNKASINVGKTSYFRLQGGTIENPLVRFQTIQSGIKLDITPWISQSGQVTVEINPEISNSGGNNSEGYPDVSTRSVNTTIRLNDGETIIIGGLIQAQDNRSINKLPFLSEIPLLGKLFQTSSTQKGSSELVIYLTPHILASKDNIDLKQDLDRFKVRMRSNKDVWDKEY